MSFEVVIGKKLIDQQFLTTSNAITNKRNKVAMMNSANNINLGLKLAIPLSTSGFQTLDGDLFAVWKDSFVDEPEPALTQ